jgi:hypothetical protein
MLPGMSIVTSVAVSFLVTMAVMRVTRGLADSGVQAAFAELSLRLPTRSAAPPRPRPVPRPVPPPRVEPERPRPSDADKKEGSRAELVNVPGRLPSSVPAGPPAPKVHVFVLDDSLFGRSGQLRTRLVNRDLASQLPEFRDTFGADALGTAAVLPLATSDDPEAFAFITMLPWYEKQGAFINRYHVGWWPGEKGRVSEHYENPRGFVEVTPENRDTRLSAHFRLGDFVTHDQTDVWPKYVVLREALLDKLELVLGQLEAQGVAVRRPVVLSGFRSPQYNARLTGEGAAYASRHQFGDAADIIIDNNGDGRMDDLDGDGHVTFNDTEVILRAVERVERRYPELVGGLGLYHAIGPSGPFAHIDVRGSRARWTNAPRGRSVQATARYAYSTAPPRSAERVGSCSATGESAILCRGSSSR